MKNKDSAIAIVGIGGIFPGARDLKAFWDLIVRRGSAAKEAPEGRWTLSAQDCFKPGGPAADKVYSKRACFVEDFVFDAKGFELDESYLERLDPSAHFALHAGRQAFKDGVTETLDRSRVGVILGSIALPTDSASELTREILTPVFEEKVLGRESLSAPKLGVEGVNHGASSLPAAALARALGLGLGGYGLDAACASSLYAIKLAVDELAAGRADAMLAGGVSRPDSLYTQMGFSQLRALSPSGVCSPFDAAGDGLVVGEGAGVLLLKRLEDAERDGDRIYAVIRGVGLSNDVGGSLLAPDSEGQLRAMRDAYAQAGWSPSDVDLIECHATGTPVGDAVEFKSLQTLWGSGASARCTLGSVKSNVGHLLTAAGAAGTIKTLLALREGKLPPTANFKAPNPNVLLEGSPFRVLDAAVLWERRSPETPRRAAVSAFGFGGINAHLLLEEHMPAKKEKASKTKLKPAPQAQAAPRPCPIAVVGLEARFGSLGSLRAFQEAVLNGVYPAAGDDDRPRASWWGADTSAWFRGKSLGARPWGGRYLADLEVPTDLFRIPPKELEEMLPQQLLMLLASAAALRDARALGRDHGRTGVFIGAELDLNTTNFNFRWSLQDKARSWAQSLGRPLSEAEEKELLTRLRDAASPPLSANRTMGALASVIASRIAREYRVGGPSFTLSGGEGSGLRALEVAVRALQRGALDQALVGAVDLGGDVRELLAEREGRPFSASGAARPFEEEADGAVPGEGAAAVVLKRLDDALRDGDRVYAVIRGIGIAAAGGLDVPASASAYVSALERAYAEAGVSPDSVGYLEAHGSGSPEEDRAESVALSHFFGSAAAEAGRPTVALGSAKAVIGDAGAAGGLASFAKACLALYQEILPPLPLASPRKELAPLEGRFHAPAAPLYWFRNRTDGPRRAGVSSMGRDGLCSHVVLEAAESAAVFDEERLQPLGARSEALFCIEEDNPPALVTSLRKLRGWAKERPAGNIEALARDWFAQSGAQPRKMLGLSLVARGREELLEQIALAEKSLLEDPSARIQGMERIFYSPEPLGRKGKIAFVFPGSGNQYLGMGTGFAAQWPEVLRAQDAENERLRDQFVPALHAPWLLSRGPGWEEAALERLSSDHKALIFGQVAHGVMLSDLVRRFGVKPDAVIGYSLGETAGLFALRAWKERDEMLRRMNDSTLFTSDLAGPCDAARRSWGLAAHEAVDWVLGVIDRPKETVRSAVGKMEKAFLLIVNTPKECVVGGTRHAVKTLVDGMGATFLPISGVTTVHCAVAKEVEDAYRELHLLKTEAPAGVRFYSGAWARAYELNRESAANAVVAQAVQGIDFTAVVNQAYYDGARVFIELGPRNTCTRMIGKILGEQPHAARSACVRDQDDVSTLLRLLGMLTAERVPVDLSELYGRRTLCVGHLAEKKKGPSIRVALGRPAPDIAWPERTPIVPDRPLTAPARPSLVPVASAPAQKSAASWLLSGQDLETKRPAVAAPPQTKAAPVAVASKPIPSPIAGEGRVMGEVAPAPTLATSALIQRIAEAQTAKALAHAQFLKVSQENFAAQMDILRRMAAWSGPGAAAASVVEAPRSAPVQPNVALTREQCLEFAVGKIGNVLGEAFAEVDAHPTRVRLPDEPLMLVDRVMSIEGQPRSMTSGRVITEHDVLPGAWYLDGGRIPTCIAVESGQADLFLSGYLGIDFQTKGKAVYRLLDAEVTFHDSLPVPGQGIRYDIRIERFARQGETYIFFFNFESTVDGKPLLSMRKGCAGFFSRRELEAGKGIVFTELDRRPVAGKKPADWEEFVPVSSGALDEKALGALRRGDLAGAFGASFEGLQLSDPLRIPGASGRMKLVDRVLELDPKGGKYGLGLIRAEADIHPDDWFLTCHFVDDKVMPGTLMYECCLHTLRIYLLRMGWVGEQAGRWFEPVPGVHSALKCRGQVLQSTKKAVYDISIKELGYAGDGTPFAVADALMYADDKPIVLIKDMSVRINGLTRDAIREIWKRKAAGAQGSPEKKKALFDSNSILAFAVGNPSEAFGAPYKIFDSERVIARLPGPPYKFLDRITSIKGCAPFELKAGGTIVAEYDVPPEAWYFRANRQKSMPFAILLEAALQPCGWFSAYLGSALHGQEDLSYRNLGGSATLYEDVFPDSGTLTTEVKMTKVSVSGGMIIQNFDFKMTRGSRLVYKGDTYFGFFTKKALADQVGLLGIKPYVPDTAELARGRSIDCPDLHPFFPEDERMSAVGGLPRPAKALRMFDAVDVYIPDGGPKGLGYIRGVKSVDPSEWFFKAHFYQDPVWPGSLGLEAFLQLLKIAARERWGSLGTDYRFEPIALGKRQEWVYRGQVLPTNKDVRIEAAITAIDDATHTITADGFLSRDGLMIYQMKDFTMRAVPR